MGARFSAPVQVCPGDHPASYTMGTGSFQGVKRPGSGPDHPLPSNAQVKERAELRLWAFVACSRVNFTFTFTIKYQSSLFITETRQNLGNMCMGPGLHHSCLQRLFETLFFFRSDTYLASYVHDIPAEMRGREGKSIQT